MILGTYSRLVNLVNSSNPIHYCSEDPNAVLVSLRAMHNARFDHQNFAFLFWTGPSAYLMTDVAEALTRDRNAWGLGDSEQFTRIAILPPGTGRSFSM